MDFIWIFIYVYVEFTYWLDVYLMWLIFNVLHVNGGIFYTQICISEI